MSYFFTINPYLTYLKKIRKYMSVIKGKRIIDLSRIIVGPYATMVLADFGCKVIKVESPEGDPTRQWGPPWHQEQSAYFLSINRNKQSIALNLKEPKCRQVLYKLVNQSDAVIENFIPGVTQKLQIDYQTLKKHNPNLVYCSISGFGDIGSKKHFPAFDNLIQAQTGFMHLTGESGEEPFKLGFAITDVVTSLYAANSVLAGLIHQMQTGQGIHLKTSLYQSAVAALVNQGSNYLNGELNPSRMGNHHPNIIPYGLYYTNTLPIIICVGTPQQYQHLLTALKLEEKLQFKTNELRIQNRKSFDKMLNEALSQFSLDEASDLLQKFKVPCGRVNDLKSMFEGRTARELQLVESVGSKRFIRSPIRTNKGNMTSLTEPPTLNQHGEQIMMELGLTPQEISQILTLSKNQQK